MHRSCCAKRKIPCKKMMEPVKFQNASCIVEYGPGTGVFTKELVRRKNNKTKLIVIEQNRLFCDTLKKKFKNLLEFILWRTVQKM